MADDITIRPEQNPASEQALSREELVREQVAEEPLQQQVAVQTAQGVACPFCGAVNEPDAVFCLSCGKPLRMGACPNCGSEMDPEADFCEVCHHYVRIDVCSFCGASLSGSEAYCPECGSPRGGIVCPTCHTLNDFAFCKQCGTPLTEDARRIQEELQARPDYQALVQLAREYEELSMQLPMTSERDVMREQMNQQLRERVLMLLAKDKGTATPEIPASQKHRMTKEELMKQKDDYLTRLTAVLDAMAIPVQPSPARVRNYAMAQKPVGVRLGWVCNFKHAIHSSPCGCAKPQLGGKWVILGKNSKQEIKDDKQ